MSLEKLRAFRGYFIVVAFVIAAIVTPPEVISQRSWAVPMCLLDEVGLWAARWVQGRAKPVTEDTDDETATTAKSDDAT